MPGDDPNPNPPAASDRNGPFTITDSREVYRNPWIAVREDLVTHDNGADGLFGIISVRDGASVVAVDAQERVFLIREFKYAARDHTLEVISGGLDDDESPLTAAQRELEEEAGLIAGDWRALGATRPLTSVLRCTMHLYLARDLRPGSIHRDPFEELEVIRMPLDEAVAAVDDGRIVHEASALALLQAWRVIRGA